MSRRPFASIFPRRPGYKYLLFVLDLLLLTFAYVISLWLHEAIHPLLSEGLQPEWPQWPFLATFGLILAVLFQQSNLYKVNVFLSTIGQASLIARNIVFAIGGLVIVWFFSRWEAIPTSRTFIVSFSFFALVFLTLGRLFIFRPLFVLLSKRRVYTRRALIVGGTSMGRYLAAEISVQNPFGVRIVGFLDDDHPKGTVVFEPYTVLGTIADAEAVVKKFRVREVLVTMENITHGALYKLLENFRRLPVTIKIASPLFGVIPEKVFAERYGSVPFSTLDGMGFSLPYRVAKRLFDIIGALVGIVLLSPLYLVLAMLVIVDSPGPVFYRQTRLGLKGKPFTFFKFRSMTVDADADTSRKTKVAKFIKEKKRTGSAKIVDDSKITKIGRFMRKTSLDELPQLFNVLRGEMSLVGPRPCLPYEWEHYEDWHKKRMDVVPGCTGIWQVSGRSEVSFDEMVILDIYYINNASLSWDLQLIFKTIPVMLFGRGAK